MALESLAQDHPIFLPLLATMTLLSVVIPTFGREQVLLDSISALLDLNPALDELLVIDQTLDHELSTEEQLTNWVVHKKLRWIRLKTPSITAAMNLGLLEANGKRVLFLDDDIIPSADLLNSHIKAHYERPNDLIAGRVLQPWHNSQPDQEEAVPFLFNTLTAKPCSEFMGGNFSIPRHLAIEVGGFDQNFVRVAYRFEAELAYRWRSAGYSIFYEPAALINHLQAQRGGTRSYGKHLTTIRPDHSVGLYYFRLRCQPLPMALLGSLCDLRRAIINRHHLRRPWWVPATFLAHLRGLLWAIKLYWIGPNLLSSPSKVHASINP